MRQALVLCSVVVLMALALPASAATTATVTDPAGDTGFRAPGYLDIVMGQVVKQGQTFQFRMDLVDPIPTKIGHLPPANQEIWWAWGIDSDPATAAYGYPVPPGGWLPVEFGMRVKWDGASFSGELVDRRPLLTGGDVIVTPIPFSISANKVSVTVKASDVGDPTTFMWDATTILRMTPDIESTFLNADGLDPFFNPWP